MVSIWGLVVYYTTYASVYYKAILLLNRHSCNSLEDNLTLGDTIIPYKLDHCLPKSRRCPRKKILQNEPVRNRSRFSIFDYIWIYFPVQYTLRGQRCTYCYKHSTSPLNLDFWASAEPRWHLLASPWQATAIRLPMHAPLTEAASEWW